MAGKYKNHKIIKRVAFFGDANISETDPEYKQAFEVAKHLAENGYTIVNGGGPGVMNASTSGARSVKGKTLSITFNPVDTTSYEGKYVKNVTDKNIETTNYVERMFKLLEKGDVFLIFKGGSGTMSEFATAWVLAKLYYGHHKPMILFGGFWVEIIDTLKKNMNLDHDEMSVFEIVRKKEEVLPVIKRFEKRMKEGDHSKHCETCDSNAFIK